MKKSDLVDKLAKTCDIKKKDAEFFLNTAFDAIVEAVAEGDKVNIAGFGIFETKERKARTGVNPRSGEKIEIQASKAPAFKASKTFKDAVK